MSRPDPSAPRRCPALNGEAFTLSRLVTFGPTSPSKGTQRPSRITTTRKDRQPAPSGLLSSRRRTDRPAAGGGISAGVTSIPVVALIGSSPSG
jgi:hypothetical protein